VLAAKDYRAIIAGALEGAQVSKITETGIQSSVGSAGMK